jgi:type IV secretory pathway TrbD component
MTDISGQELIPGFEAPVHRALTEPILLAGAGLVLWALGHMAAVWAAKRDPLFVEVVRRHVRFPTHLGA